jgi:predicted nucleic acid-binding protein
MAKSKAPVYCWDSTVLLAWLQEEATAPLGDIELVVKEIDSKEATLIIPATVYTEILEARLKPGERDKLDAFLKRSNVIAADLTVPIARRAADMRNRGLEEQPKRRIKTPDAHMAATALSLAADVLHTLDSDLLQLHNHPTAENLNICQPRPLFGQKGLISG